MSDLCQISDGGDCLNSCGMLAILTEVTREEMTHEEQPEMASTLIVAEGEARVLEQPNLYNAEEQEGRLSLKEPPSLIEVNHVNKGMTGGDYKKLQYALRSNPKKSCRFLQPPDRIKSSAAPASSINIISSITTAITSTPSEIATATAAPLSSPPPPPPPAAPVKKLNSIYTEKARACTECGRQFPSWKALFGHMRCHPERQWRGIQRPSSIPTKEKPTKQGKPPSPISKALPIRDPQSENSRAQAPLHGYLDGSDTESIEAAYINERDQDSPKSQRASKSHLQDDIVLSCHFSHSPSPTESEVMDEHDMADCLVMLAFAAKADSAAEPSDCNSGQEEPGLEVHSRLPLITAESREKKRSYSCMQKSSHPIQARGEKATKYDEDGTWERKSKFECTTNATEDASLLQVEETKATTQEEMMIDMQQEEPFHAAEEKRTEQDDSPEHCKMSMGQFLQYSMTCHEKTAEDKHDSAITLEKKQLKHQTSSCSSSSSIIAATAAAGTLLMHHHHNHLRQQMLLSKTHQCTVCSRVFSTGQALGGHKRCHWGTSSAPHSTPSQNSDGDCGENPQICLNICSSERSSELSRKGQQDSSSSASEQILVTDMALKQEFEPSRNRGLDSTPLGDAKASWLVEANQENLELSNKIHANAITGSSIADGKAWLGGFLSHKYEESRNACHQRRHQGSFYERDANDSAEATQQNARAPKEELLDLNLPAPVEDAEEAQAAAQALLPSFSEKGLTPLLPFL